jgi:flagellar hook protein FlgE
MAGFNTAISGIRAATAALDVTGNNIANASTTGFKSSRTEFADIYATAAIGSGATNVPGSGVLVSDIAQDFSGGNVQFTNNNLDLSIDGSGFFQLDDGRGSVTYTRDGSFELDKEGFIVSKGGQNLQGYGVDERGNRLPVSDLRVTEKESPPKATENMALSFNIDEASDAETLIEPYSRTESGSYTFSTTVGTFDSLGNEHTIRYDMVEQQAKNEVHTFDYAGTSFDISGQTLDTTALGAGPLDFGAAVGTVSTINDDALAALQVADPRIGNVTYDSAAPTPKVTVTYKSDSTEYGALVTSTALSNEVVTKRDSNEKHIFSIPQGGGVAPNPTGSFVTAQQFSIAGIPFNLNATVSEPLTREQIANEIISKETQIRDANPNIESIGFDQGTNELTFTFKAESGDVGNTSLQVTQTDGNFFGGTPAVVTPAVNEVQTTTLTSFVPGQTIIIGGATSVTIPASAPGADGDAAHLAAIGALVDASVAALPNVATSVTTGANTVVTFNSGINEGALANTGTATVTVAETTAGAAAIVTTPAVEQFGPVVAGDISDGDNSFQGVYRMYAYLNPLGQRPEALDIGKPADAGSALSQTEIGPIVVRFNPTNGILSEVNGEDVPTGVGAQVPKITIKNADPADASTTITLDLTGTTQFANEQIVKTQSQDGYTKGDLTGVSFTPQGEMIATFSNNQSTTLGIVAVATFENQAGMQPSGNTQWIATNASGEPVLNPPGSGLNGSLRSSALESSNVDLSAELVKLIESQRNFQASSKTLETLNTVTQNILQI